MKVVLLGRLREVAGWRERTLDPVPASLSALRAALAAADEALGAALAGKGVQVALNKQVIREDAALGPSDEVAFMPPMSGG